MYRRSSFASRVRAAALLLTVAALPLHAHEAEDPPGRVARVNLVVGKVSLEPAGTESWVSDVLNRPLTTGDKLWSDRESRAELHIGSNAVRLGGETGMSLLNVDDRTIQLRLSAGTLAVKVRALGPDQTFEVATPAAAVSIIEPGEYRIDVNDSGEVLRVSALRGQVAIASGAEATTLRSGEHAEYAGGGLAGAIVQSLPPGDAFDQWVADRDRREDRAVATRYVSREVIGYEDLDDYGSWRVMDEYGPVWMPTVAVGWAPYREGHWAWISPWGWTWIDEAPWGFAPFHYGRWLYVGERWCWAPGPRHHAPIYAPALVGWVGGSHWSVGVSIGGGGPVGWFPLGWNEVYVPGYRVSNTYVRNINVTNIHVTNEYVTNYITRNPPGGDEPGRKGTGDRDLNRRARGGEFRNIGVPGAVTATSRSVFTGAEPVHRHLSEVPREGLERAAAGTAAPAIAPSARSIGRPGESAPRVGGDYWTRPVVARTAPPAVPVPFEQERRAIVANGGLPVTAAGSGSDQRGNRPSPRPAPAIRSDVIRTEAGPVPAAGRRRETPPDVERPRDGSASRDGSIREPSRPAAPGGERQPPRDRRVIDERRAAPGARSVPDYRPAPTPAPQPPARESRPAGDSPRAPEYRPPQAAPDDRRNPRGTRSTDEARPPVASRAVPEDRPPPRDSRSVYESRPTPDYRRTPPVEARPAPRESRPTYEARPAPERRPTYDERPPPRDSRPAYESPPAPRESRPAYEARPVPESRSAPPPEARSAPREMRPAYEPRPAPAESRPAPPPREVRQPPPAAKPDVRPPERGPPSDHH